MPVSPVKMADAIRVLSMDAVHKAKSGHQGMPMGMADVATVLWGKFLKFDAAKPDWADRDRFVLSAGHGSMLLYSLLHLTGFKAVTMQEIENFRQWGSLTPGHPEVHHTPGVETTTGPLGQGLATAVGMAMAEAPPGRALRPGRRRPPHLGDRRRRLPDGRRQPRGDQPGRPPEAQQADRAVRRQQHHHRRRGHHRRDRRPAGASRPPAGRSRPSTATITARSPPPCAGRPSRTARP
jgi:hypothetical protein